MAQYIKQRRKNIFVPTKIKWKDWLKWEKEDKKMLLWLVGLIVFYFMGYFCYIIAKPIAIQWWADLPGKGKAFLIAFVPVTIIYSIICGIIDQKWGFSSKR